LASVCQVRGCLPRRVRAAHAGARLGVFPAAQRQLAPPSDLAARGRGSGRCRGRCSLRTRSPCCGAAATARGRGRARIPALGGGHRRRRPWPGIQHECRAGPNGRRGITAPPPAAGPLPRSNAAGAAAVRSGSAGVWRAAALAARPCGAAARCIPCADCAPECCWLCCRLLSSRGFSRLHVAPMPYYATGRGRDQERATSKGARHR